MKRAAARVSVAAAAAVGATSLLPLVLVACESSAPAAAAPDTIADVTDRLLASLERRRDVRNLKVAVQRVECALCAAPRQQRATLTRLAYHQHIEGLDALLERELVVQLAPRLELVEGKRTAQPADAAAAALPEQETRQQAQRLGADAILAADYTRVGDRLYLSLRILDAESMVVLAASRGIIDGVALLGRR